MARHRVSKYAPLLAAMLERDRRWSGKKIAAFLDVDLRTVQRWLQEARPRLAALQCQARSGDRDWAAISKVIRAAHEESLGLALEMIRRKKLVEWAAMGLPEGAADRPRNRKDVTRD